MFEVQHIDLKAGARIRVASQSTGSQFTKRTAEQWYNFLPGNVAPPPGTTLFSTTNASYFENTTNGQSTALSFPEKKGYVMTSYGAQSGNDPYQKAFLGIPAQTSPAYVELATFPTTGDPNTINNALAAYKDGIVSYCANCGPNAGEITYRTFIAAADTDGNGTKDQVWIFVSYGLAATAQKIYDYFRLTLPYRTPYAIQMDGGNSTQFWSAPSHINSALCNIPFQGCREVPNVVAVYAANASE